MVPVEGGRGEYFSGDQVTTNKNRRKIYDIPYKAYVKAKGKFPPHDYLGPIDRTGHEKPRQNY